MTYALFALDRPPTHPCIDVVDAAVLVRVGELTEVRFQRANDMLFGVLKYWVHQNPGNHIYGGIKKYGKWQDRLENLSVCLLKSMTHLPKKSGENLSQPSKWSLIVYELGSLTLRG